MEELKERNNKGKLDERKRGKCDGKVKEYEGGMGRRGEKKWRKKRQEEKL